MSTNEAGRAQGNPVWLFMAATAMATTVSTLAASAMVKADAPEPVEVTCACEAAPAVAAVEPQAPALAPEAPVAEQAPAVAPEAPVAEQAPAVAPKAPEGPKADVGPGLSADLVRRIVKAHIGEVRYCYNEGLKEDPELGGRVVVDFTVGTKGRVTKTEVSSTGLEDSDVPACVAGAVGRWLFPRPADGQEVQITYPFVLEPG
jgi:hypothetical protein